MFEDISEAPKRSGLRGFVYRHFGKILDADQAADDIKIYTVVFLVLGLIGVFAGSVSRRLDIGVTGAVLLVLTGLVRGFKSRVAAGLLFGIEALSVLTFHLISILWAAFALRLLQACFAYHRLSRASPVSIEPPPPPAPVALPPRA